MFSILTACSAQLIFLDLITLLVMGEELKLRDSSLSFHLQFVKSVGDLSAASYVV
jgi:hypothetical protein